MEKEFFQEYNFIVKAWFKFIPYCLAIVILPITSRPQGVLIDQSDSLNTKFYYNLLSLPIGQEFVPTFQSLDFVNLMTYGSDGPVTATFQVAIHQGSITAPVLAISNPSSRTDGNVGLSHFDFPFEVPLVPGNTYVIQLLLVSGAPVWWAVGCNQSGDYLQGRMILGGALNSQFDLSFQEGMTVPEPSVMALSLMGIATLIGFVKKRFRLTFFV